MRTFLAVFTVLALLPCAAPGAFAYTESPALAARVLSGELPPVDERLPKVPMLVQPVDSVGTYGGTWRIGSKGTRDHAIILRHQAYENLVRWDPDWTRVIPNLALSVEASKDATSYTFRLRPGLKWSDGRPFTADDILFWHEDVFSHPDLADKRPAWLMSGGEPVSVTKLDDHTVIFRFGAPHGLFLQHLAMVDGAEPTSYPKHYLKAYHPRYNPEGVAKMLEERGLSHWTELFQSVFGQVGGIDDISRWKNPGLPVLYAWKPETGYDPEAGRFYAERNPYYWKVDTEGNQLPYIDRLEYVVGKRGDLAKLMAQGELDVQQRHVGSNRFKDMYLEAMESSGLAFFRTVYSQSATFAILPNLTHKDPVLRAFFQNKDVRVALSTAVDRVEFGQRLDAPAFAPPYQVAPRPESPFYTEKMATQYTAFDPALASALLDKAGYAKRDAEGYRLRPDGKTLAFTVLAKAESKVDEAQRLAAMWRAVGLKATGGGLDREGFFQLKYQNDHDMLIEGLDGGLDVILSPGGYLSLHSGVAWDIWRRDPSDPLAQEPPDSVKERFALYEQIKATGDQEEQARIMRRILEIAADDFHNFGLNLVAEGFGVRRKAMKNVPEVMPMAWTYPTPAPTNPCQYYLEEPK